MRRDLVVIGASVGGIDALRTLVRALPEDFPAAICAVVHLAPDSPSVLDEIIRRAGCLPVHAVVACEPLRPGTIYLPIPDHHLIVEPSAVRVTRGPKENRFRPAVDPLFRSAAQAYGPRVVGVILTGNLDDGTAGLWTVQRLGGIAVVQDPADAVAPSMPDSARRHMAVDHCLPIADLPALLCRLTAEDLAQSEGYVVPEPIGIEVSIAKQDFPLEAGVEALGKPSIFSCPECHGVLLQIREGERLRYRCHSGHGYSLQSLLADLDRAIEESLWHSVRSLQEKLLLARHLERHAHAQRDAKAAEGLRALADAAERRAAKVREALSVADTKLSGAARNENRKDA